MLNVVIYLDYTCILIISDLFYSLYINCAVFCIFKEASKYMLSETVPMKLVMKHVSYVCS